MKSWIDKILARGVQPFHPKCPFDRSSAPGKQPPQVARRHADVRRNSGRLQRWIGELLPNELTRRNVPNRVFGLSFIGVGWTRRRMQEVRKCVLYPNLLIGRNVHRLFEQGKREAL